MLAAMIKVILVTDTEEVGFGCLGGEDLCLHLADLLLRGFELRKQIGNFGIFVLDGLLKGVVCIASIVEFARNTGMACLKVVVFCLVLAGELSVCARQTLVDLGETCDLFL